MDPPCVKPAPSQTAPARLSGVLPPTAWTQVFRRPGLRPTDARQGHLSRFAPGQRADNCDVCQLIPGADDGGTIVVRDLRERAGGSATRPTRAVILVCCQCGGREEETAVTSLEIEAHSGPARCPR